MEPTTASDTNAIPAQTMPVPPDEATKKRIDNLAVVGTALAEWSNGTKFDGNIIAAKEALKAFKEGIDKLELAPPAKVGMDNLIKLLAEQLEGKLSDTFTTTQANF